MAAAVEEATALKVGLVEGSGGIFEVRVDGRTVYAKPKGARFPTGEEIVGIVRGLPPEQ